MGRDGERYCLLTAEARVHVHPGTSELGHGMRGHDRIIRQSSAEVQASRGPDFPQLILTSRATNLL